ncbi:PEP-CTERM sorting domain-containing protein [Bythopirellula polymerisocia]|uniref:PEP-CTERM protein-sorting domain-containing protein n=1 Tax=Bythopirellula polymerisocia TaxID=2528003 RepID=A0A5C6CE64_9BACT|nr:PEP-CTERM sorting domain-containing protein [Bythopirellula polymerisocia]TWU21794.1 hypothetical protein Pla144_44900 [Bythopirellula polymerisocia]
MLRMQQHFIDTPVLSTLLTNDQRASSPAFGFCAIGYFLVLLTFLGSGLTTQADAGQIAVDHFLTGNPANTANGEYSVTQLRRSEVNGAGQDPTIPGFTDPWTGNVTSGSLAVAQWTAESAPTGSTVGYQQGGRARFGGSSAVNALQRRVQRELSSYAPSNTYYMSLITQIATGDLAGADGFVGAGFTNSDPSVTQQDANIVGGSALRGVLIGAASSDGSVTDFVVRHVGSTGFVQNDVLESNIDNIIPTLTILKLEFNDDPGNPNGNSKLTVWQNPTDFSSESAASASVTPVVLRTFALGTNADMTHLTLTGLNYSKAASFDEPTLGTSWASVIPEPGTAVLIASVLLFSGMTRKRRMTIG